MMSGPKKKKKKKPTTTTKTMTIKRALSQRLHNAEFKKKEKKSKCGTHTNRAVGKKKKKRKSLLNNNNNKLRRIYLPSGTYLSAKSCTK
jgi:hypothetical protein